MIDNVASEDAKATHLFIWPYFASVPKLCGVAAI
ncbi:hypothetical protein ETAA8_43310 [Anatilimnocola aggregata]|uniref:Uncharacterized protein n=1 Tax=Anatilimnocola aggregata TaxID=2528021 RepID=A0A517YG78_9BACT|nr:hypothetical protein ETAA8_43310 [Anatilimnocola aggregata]